jgi:hypothetical protein
MKVCFLVYFIFYHFFNLGLICVMSAFNLRGSYDDYLYARPRTDKFIIECVGYGSFRVF